jgi:protein-S-isoprenylcysteine O-methyltransferase Ste14
MAHDFPCVMDPTWEVRKSARQRFSLARSNLRGAVLLLGCGSAYFFPASPLKIGISLLLLGAGCLLHLLVKGVLIRNTVLCKEGIYTFTRHPYYTANYLIDTGFCLLSGNTYLLLAYPSSSSEPTDRRSGKKSDT